MNRFYVRSVLTPLWSEHSVVYCLFFLTQSRVLGMKFYNVNSRHGNHNLGIDTCRLFRSCGIFKDPYKASLFETN